MKLLLDSHLLVWVVSEHDRLPKKAQSLIRDPHNQLFFSVASIWELAIKSGLKQKSVPFDVRLLRQVLLNNDYSELPVTAVQAIEVATLPPIHKDPFDRLLIAQARVEGMMLLTSDGRMGKYPGSIMLL